MSIQLNFKRVMKCGVSLAVFAFTELRDALCRCTGKVPRGTCVILYYHSIPSEQQTAFAKQLDMVVKHAVPIAIADDLKLKPAGHFVGVTFDDGFENFAQVALSELEKRSVPSTVFVIVDALGKAFGPPGDAERVMSIDQLRQLPQDLVTIGSHTLSHPFLPALADQEAEREIAESRAKLESLLHRDVAFFSFPFGGFSEKHVGQCRAAGYQTIFTTLPQMVPHHSSEFVVGRVRVDASDWPLEFRLKLAGAYRWLPWAFSLKRFILSRVAPLLGNRPSVGASDKPHSVVQELPKSTNGSRCAPA